MRFIYTKAFAIFSACLVLVVLLVFLETKGWLDPLREALLQAPRPIVIVINNVTAPVKDFFSTIYQLKKIDQDNARLQSQVAMLEQNLVSYQELTRENQSLRDELGFAQSSKLPLLPCTVLSQNPFGQTDAVIINCGSSQGTAAGQAVISQGYLVGKIIYAGHETSTVLLATASDFSTDALISQTQQTAIVTGSFNSGLILDQVPQTADLSSGWLVVTAGITAQVPKNILIGQVSQILSSNNDLFKRASLTSPIDYNNLQFVFVVKQ
jgi:rod shape-determining protein MreC